VPKKKDSELLKVDKKVKSEPAPPPKDKKDSDATVAQTPLKKPKKNAFKLQALNHALPKNLQECYDRFFESGFKINPQFEYENAASAARFLE
jgi:hypothetical protein